MQQKPIIFSLGCRAFGFRLFSGDESVKNETVPRGSCDAKAMSETPTEDLIRYDVMVQEALLGVVRKVLQDAARLGLPGEHHFYVTFRSQAPGVKISARLREKYPDEMTIVLQHQFWDLVVGEAHFEVGLSFGGVPEKLSVPYDALTGFYDPSVQFGLKFTPDEAQADNDAGEDAPGDLKSDLETLAAREGKAGSKATVKDRKRDAVAEQNVAPTESEIREPAKAGDDEGDKPAAGAEVVSLEAFRKKK